MRRRFDPMNHRPDHNWTLAQKSDWCLAIADRLEKEPEQIDNCRTAFSSVISDLAGKTQYMPNMSLRNDLALRFNQFVQLNNAPTVQAGATSQPAILDFRDTGIIVGYHITTVEGSDFTGWGGLGYSLKLGSTYELTSGGTAGDSFAPISPFNGSNRPYQPVIWYANNQTQLTFRFQNLGFSDVTPRVSLAFLNVSLIKP